MSTPSEPPTGPRSSDLGGAVVIRGPGRQWGIVHFGPEPGACSVDVDGCGYCIGVPCRQPTAAANPTVSPPDDPTSRTA